MTLRAFERLLYPKMLEGAQLLGERPYTHRRRDTWRPIQVDIVTLRTALAARGLVRDNHHDYFPDEDWTPWLAVSRRRAWPRTKKLDCDWEECLPNGGPCGTNHTCPDRPDTTHTEGNDTFTEGKLADHNSDGFPDFIANKVPARLCEEPVAVLEECVDCTWAEVPVGSITATTDWVSLDACPGDDP